MFGNTNIGDVPQSIPVGKDILMVFNMTLFDLSRYSLVVFTIYYNNGPFGPSKILWRPSFYVRLNQLSATQRLSNTQSWALGSS